MNVVLWAVDGHKKDRSPWNMPHKYLQGQDRQEQENMFGFHT